MANNKAKGPSLPASHSPPWPDSTRPSPAHEPVAEPWPDRLPEAASPARPVLSLPCQAHVFTPSLGRAGLTSQPLALQLPTSEPPEQGTGQKGQGPDTPGPQALPTLTEPLSVNWERLRNQPPRAGDRVKHHSPTNRTCWQLPGVPHSKAPARRHAGPDAYPHQWCAHSDKRFSSAPICPAGEGRLPTLDRQDRLLFISQRLMAQGGGHPAMQAQGAAPGSGWAAGGVGGRLCGIRECADPCDVPMEDVMLV